MIAVSLPSVAAASAMALPSVARASASALLSVAAASARALPSAARASARAAKADAPAWTRDIAICSLRAVVSARRRAAPRQVRGLLDNDGGRLRRREAVVPGPLEGDGAALRGHGREGEERVGGDGGVQLGAEDLGAVVGAHEEPDDVAGDRGADLAPAVPGLHGMRDQGLDLDDLTAPGPRGHIDQGGHGYVSSRQAARVTTTSARWDQNDPSLSSAMATTVCVSARRMRVDTRARPARGPRRTVTTSGWGFFSVKTCNARTWSASVIGLSTLTVRGTAFPFSDSGGNSSFTRPALTRAVPTILRMASSIAAGVARAGVTAMARPNPTPAATPPAATRNSRREVRAPISPSASSRMPPRPRSAPR